MSWGQGKEIEQKKINLESDVMYWYYFCLFKMGFNHVMYRDSFILN